MLALWKMGLAGGMARERAENGYNSLAGKLLKKTPLE
jgi:hypothetical protein